MTVNIQYGCDSISKTYSSTPTVGQILSDANVKAVLGCGDNVRAMISGIEMPTDALVPDGATLRVETRAHGKAVA